MKRYRRHPVFHLIHDTETNEMFEEGSRSSAAESYQEWLEGGNTLETDPPEEEQVSLLKSDLERRLAKIDFEVNYERSTSTFVWGSNTYYVDLVTLPVVYMALPLLPSNFSMSWKTADKDTDGVSSIYTTVDKKDISDMFLAQMNTVTAIWNAGDAKKKAIKKEVADMLIKIKKTKEE